MAARQPFMVSAPGKVIVFGEHSVVHGKAAMAASISLRSYLHVQPLPEETSPSVTLNFVDISLSHTWSISSLPWQAFASAQSALDLSAPPTVLDPVLVEAMQPHITAVSSSLSEHQGKIHQAAAATFLYLYLLLSSPSAPSTSFTLRSTIPIGAGLGSSASISVCLSAALLHLSGSGLGPASESESLTQIATVPSKAVLDRINAFAFLGESLIHGTPSGVDNTVSTLGKAVIFRRSSPSASTAAPGAKPASSKPSITTLRHIPELPLLIVDTKQPKSTAAQVAKVAAIKAAQPVVVDPILDAMDHITTQAAALFEAMPSAATPATSKTELPSAADAVEELGQLITLNHGLLYTLGVSHPRLEELKRAVDDSGVGFFKLTGGGGGGCGFVLLRSEYAAVVRHARQADAAGADGPAGKLHALERELEAKGFEEYETVLGGEGVGISLSGVMSQETFLAAKGREGVEELCSQQDWRYWSFE